MRVNEANRYPRRLIFLDSEAQIEQTESREDHSFRVCHGELVTINPRNLDAKVVESCTAFTPDQFWTWVSETTTSRERTILAAHNLSYDVRVTQAFRWLIRFGWTLKAVALDNRCCWARWARGRESLCMIDSSSFLPKPLDVIGGELGLTKLDLPEQNDPQEAWILRCKTDVEILREATLRTLRYLERNNLGAFRLTGAAQSTAAFRHRFYQPKGLLVHKDSAALESERNSAHTGRCEVWKHGARSETLYEWDYSLAYATIAKALELPVRLRGTVGRIPAENVPALAKRYRLCLDCEVSTDVPVVPTRHDGRILWPVGQFRSWLWDDEIKLALSEGAKIRPRWGWSYDKAPLLAEWAEWILGELQGKNGSLDPMARIMLKSWSRALIGRFGLRYPQWKAAGTMPDSDLRFVQFVDTDDDERGAYLQVGTELLEQYGLTDSPDSCPSIMSAVMSAARCRLWRAMKYVGLENVAYVDTDSLLVNFTGSVNAMSLARQPEHSGLRLKGQHASATLYGPRTIELGDERRIAGLPRRSEWIGQDAYSGEVWQSAAESLKRGNANAVTVTRRIFHPSREDHRRIHLENGETEAVPLYG